MKAGSSKARRLGLLSRLFSARPDPRDELRPLWDRIVALAREERLYRDLSVADTVNGRFDMISAVLAVVVARLAADEATIADSAYLTELFVQDMDGQLREMGIGDVVVGKHVGKLMGLTGGRVGAYRQALTDEDGDALAAAVGRNVEWSGEPRPKELARLLRKLWNQLGDKDRDELLKGDISWN
jgi:cytochrome b pre-mRNA-processing protein 3